MYGVSSFLTLLAIYFFFKVSGRNQLLSATSRSSDIAFPMSGFL